MAFVKMLQTVDKWQAGEHYDIPEDFLASAMIANRSAEPVNYQQFDAATRGARDHQLVEQMRTVWTQMFDEREKTRGAAENPQPPGSGQGVDFGHIATGNDPADIANARLLHRIKDAKERGGCVGMGEILSLAGMVHKGERAFTRAQVDWATKRMRGICGYATEEAFDETTGKWTSKHTRDMGHGSFETVIRTGTDSLAGGTGYGFAIKPDYLGNIFEISMERQVFANEAQRIPVTQGVETKWPAWDQYQAPTTANGVMQSAVFAGIQLYYETEAAPRIPTDGKLNMIDFKIVDLTAFTALSRDFVVDNYLQFDSALTRMIGRAFGWMEDYMSIQGPGIGRPQGYFNSPATLVVTRHSGSTVTSNDVTSMIAAVSPMVWDNLRWITNITCFPQLAILANNSGTPIFQPNALISQADLYSIMKGSEGGRNAELMHRPMGSLLGFPVYFSEKVPALGNQGDLSLVSPREYGIAQRSGLEIAMSEHYYFLNDLIAYRLKLRHDGKGLWRGPYIQADGSSTNVSPFVLLS